MEFNSGAHPGILHHYAPRLVAFEPATPQMAQRPQNLLIWIGGLTDGLLTVPYPIELAAALPPTWSLAQVLLSSSYSGWGTSSLQHDVEELAQCVEYFRNVAKRTGKIVLMGSSTGCQDVMHYLVGPEHETRPPIDGGILQASISDREAGGHMVSKEQLTSTNKLAEEWVAAGRGEDALPMAATHWFFESPVCARRWLSLASPNHDGEDDYFSSDLSDQQLQKTFGSLPKRTKLCILYSGADEYVPEHVDKKALVDRWVGIIKSGSGALDEKYTGVVEGANHTYNGISHEIVNDLFKRVIGFVSDL